MKVHVAVDSKDIMGEGPVWSVKHHSLICHLDQNALEGRISNTVLQEYYPINQGFVPNIHD